jgi:hypothetical protein
MSIKTKSKEVPGSKKIVLVDSGVFFEDFKIF